MTEVVLDVSELRAWYGTEGDPVRAVDGVSFEIRAGETLGLVGESGCGKSTLGRSILGLLPEGSATSGEIRYRDRNLLAIAPKEVRSLRGPDLGLIFQEPMTRLDPLVTIERHFMETLKTHEPDMSEREKRTQSLEALAAMGIPPTRFKQYPHEFSGGMRQRIMIAMALACEPALVLADEPTTALDVTIQAQILELMADLRRNFDTALLLITHNLGIVAEACDRVAVMYAGRIVEQGGARTVFAEPAHPYTRALLDSIISLGTTDLRYIPGAPPSLIDPPPACRFHPRCPNAMAVCASKFPIETRVADGHRTECWLHGPDDEIPPGGDRPLERGEIAIAEEA